VLEVVIVSYRCGPMLRECLQSLQQHPPARGLRITVVDNDSGDGTADVVRREFQDVRLIALDENVGFSAANNLVLLETTAEYVLVLNPDTRICKGTLETLLRLMDANKRVGIAGCRLVQEDGTFDHAARRSFPTPASALGHFLRVGRSEHAPASLAAYRAPDVGEGPVDAVNGAYYLHQLVRIYIRTGETDKAIDGIEALRRLRYFISPGYLRIDPGFDPLRGNPRFQKLVGG
jgi:GT2 family glycosyltransferase